MKAEYFSLENILRFLLLSSPLVALALGGWALWQTFAHSPWWLVLAVPCALYVAASVWIAKDMVIQ